MKWSCRAILATTLVCGSGADARATSLEQDRNTEERHGLYEIRQEAVRFLEAHNKATGENWIALDPNLKVLVPRCQIALTAKWLPKSHGASGDNVVIGCASPRDWGDPRGWTVFVPAKKAH